MTETGKGGSRLNAGNTLHVFIKAVYPCRDCWDSLTCWMKNSPIGTEPDIAAIAGQKQDGCCGFRVYSNVLLPSSR